MATARRSAIEYYPGLSSRWPHGSGRAPTNNDLEQAFALLLSLGPRKRPRDTREALAVAGYLSDFWDPLELGRAIAKATGTDRVNEWLNIITQPPPEGLRGLALFTLHEQLGGRKKLSITLTAKGRDVVAAYCTREGIEILVEEAGGPDYPALTEAEGDLPVLDQVELMQTSLEGKRLLREHIARERDPVLVRRFKNQLSSFSCYICTFDFEKRYGPIGRGFIEAHHLEPIGSRDGGTPTSVEELIAVCSNCHRMLRRQAPPYTADDIKAFMDGRR